MERSTLRVFTALICGVAGGILSVATPAHAHACRERLIPNDYLFSGGRWLPAPFPRCGTLATGLECQASGFRD